MDERTAVEVPAEPVTEEQIVEQWDAETVATVPDFELSAEMLARHGLGEDGDRALARIYPACCVESGWSRA